MLSVTIRAWTDPIMQWIANWGLSYFVNCCLLISFTSPFALANSTTISKRAVCKVDMGPPVCNPLHDWVGPGSQTSLPRQAVDLYEDTAVLGLGNSIRNHKRSRGSRNPRAGNSRPFGSGLGNGRSKEGDHHLALPLALLNDYLNPSVGGASCARIIRYDIMMIIIMISRYYLSSRFLVPLWLRRPTHPPRCLSGTLAFISLHCQLAVLTRKHARHLVFPGD